MTNFEVFEQVKLYFDTLHENTQNGGVFEYGVSGRNCLYHNSLGNCINLISRDLMLENKNVFVTLHAFHSDTYNNKTSLRNENNLWGMDCLMLDIDGPVEFCGKEQELYDRLSWVWKKDLLPEPNLYSFTGGGGIHLYYSFNRLPKQMKKSVTTVKKFFAAKLQECVTEYELFPKVIGNAGEILTYHIDTKIFDTQRLDRVPGSTNFKTGNKCICFKTGAKRYTIQALFEYINDDLYAIKKSSKPRKYNFNRPKHNVPFARLFKKRVNGLFELQKNGKTFNGCRNQALFIIINSLKQLSVPYDEICQCITDFNNGFPVPLRQSELNALCRSAKKENVYKFTNQYIKDALYLTPSEEKVMFASSRPGNKKQQMFNDRVNVAKLVVKGKTIAEISKILHISESRIKKARCFIKLNGGFQFWALSCDKKAFFKKVLKRIVEKCQSLSTERLFDGAKNTLFSSIIKSSFCNVSNIFSVSIVELKNNIMCLLYEKHSLKPKLKEGLYDNKSFPKV